MSADEISAIYHAGPACKGSPSIPPPELRITAAQRFGNDLRLTFLSVAGKSYVIQSHADLTSTTWTTLSNTMQSGIGGTLQITVSNALSQLQQFYRVQQQP